MKTLITCHANADCDAFAAMLACRHLYANAALLFPGTQEAGLAKIYASLDKNLYGFIEPKNLDPDVYECLVLVDTRQKSRVGHIASLLAKPGIMIEVWDHHPASGDDIAPTSLNLASTGAITSALCLELQKRGIRPDPGEATLLGLGIYGDTGSFTYSSTTASDFQAAAWLLGMGMDVNRINDMACHELTGPHVAALNSLLESARTYMVNNVPVVIAEASVDHYLGDFAYLAQKLMEIGKFDVLFAIGIMGDRIQVVARGRVDKINVGKVCAQLGGGGHTFAASASVRGKMITEVREAILRYLNDQANPAKIAREYMSSPPIGVDSSATIQAADELMLHFGLKAVPVFSPDSRACVGMLDAQTAARAASHGLGAEKVEEYMRRRIETLPPDASLSQLAEIIVRARQRLVPIVENGEVMGVVTRTDLINVLADEAGSLGALRKTDAKPYNLAKFINEKLPRETRRILELAGNVGEKLGLPVYAVGGFVRDLLLHHPNQDIDIVAEGNGIAVARELARELGGRVREHDKFLTSVVIYHDDQGVECHIDVATARLEYYEYPAALPTVELSSIKMDLFRRDFSINALAVRLDGGQYGDLVDFFGGRRDVRDRIIRVLHTLSFVEDPTRAIRAVRFEQRYNFRIGPGTQKLIKNMLPMRLLEKLSPHRLFNEYKHIANEERAPECFIRMDELGIMKALGPNLTLNPGKIERLKRIRDILSWYRLLYFEEETSNWICYFLALCHNLNYAESSENYRCLGLPEAKKAVFMRQRENMRAIRPKLLEWQKRHDQGGGKISALCDLLRDFSLEFLLYLMAACGDAGLEKNISRYITQWRAEKADINGNDLRRIGVNPGPLYSHLLKIALDAKLDGRAPNAKSQLAMVIAELKKERLEA